MNGIYILVDTYMSFLERGREFLSPLRSDDRLRRTIAAEFVEIAFFMRFLERGRELIAAQVVGSKLLMLLIYIILLASAMLACFHGVPASYVSEWGERRH